MSEKVTSEMVKKLRERTGVGMAKCKEALDKCNGDMEKAIDFLRKAGIASAVKKEGRETNEGMIYAAIGKDAIALVEVNAETDFVTQNEKFKDFTCEIAQEVADTRPSSLQDFLKQKYRKDTSVTIDQYRALCMQNCGENIQIKRLLVLPKSKGSSFGIYSHMNGKIVAIVELSGGEGHEALAREIAMHVAAEAPEFLRPEDVPADLKAREEEIARGQIQGKPENIVNKIVEGKINSFYDLVCLLRQKFIKDNNLTIAALLEQEAKRLGKPIAILRFFRWGVGS
jgi:elongation factor Ts